jgi:hypothetical protein
MILTMTSNINGAIAAQGQNNTFVANVTASGGVSIGNFNQQYVGITAGNTLAALRAFSANLATLGVAPNGTITEGTAFVADSVSMQHTGSPTLVFTSAYGFKANNLGTNLTAGVTIGTNYGLWVDKQTGATTNYQAFFNTTNPIAVWASGCVNVGSNTDCGAGIVNALNGYTVGTATKTLTLKQGANGTVGTFVCTGGGTITISNTNVATSDTIIISMAAAGGTITTPPAFKTITGATGFTVLCGATDTSTYNYGILKNAA